MSVGYDLITEIGGTAVTGEAASMMYTRYAVASDLARGKRTLEIGCATGVGLGLLLREASFVVGGDVFLPMLQTARRHYGIRVDLAQFSAEHLPFKDNSFDVVLFLEATYYVEHFEKALDEIDRILDSGGTMFFVNANPERRDFIRSPHSVHYHSAREFRDLLEQRGYQVETSGAFAIAGNGGTSLARHAVSRALTLARKIAETLHLVPRTLAGRARIKRLIFGKLKTMPPELPRDFAPAERLAPLGDARATDYKVIYVVGKRVKVAATAAAKSHAAAAV